MNRPPLYRNVRARGSLELFLLSGITSLLAVRFYLHVTGYPQIGGDTLHIAHMLWGGLLMLASITVALAFLGAWSQRIAALVGGAGFGVFIDEIGKFITHDNDYFFRPAIGIIYAIFVIIYMLFSYLTREQKLSSREYQLNALVQLEEAVESDFDPAEKARVMELLDRAQENSLVTDRIRELVKTLETVDARPPGWAERTRMRFDDMYRRFWQRRETSMLVRYAFILQAAILLVGVLAVALANIEDLLFIFDSNGGLTYPWFLLVGQMASAAVAAGFALYGAVLLRRSRLSAFEQFRRATLINLLLTQFFVFFREQFAAMPGFVFNLTVLLAVTYVIHQEQRLKDMDSDGQRPAERD